MAWRWCSPACAISGTDVSAARRSAATAPADPLGLGEFAASKTSANKLAYADPQARAVLYQANCLELLDRLNALHPQGSFDMIFADPPYFLSNGGITCQNGKMVKVDKGDWDKSRSPQLNHEFNLQWLQRCQRALKPNGTLWVSGTHHVIHSVGFAMQQLGMKLLNDITWEKPNPPPNLACRTFTHATETLIWAAKSEKSRYRFDYARMKADNDGKQMKSVWRFTAPAKQEKSHGRHPTQKPIDLLLRCIEASTQAGDRIFDPFNGSGTTGVAALRSGRRYVGSELDPAYARLSKARLKAELDAQAQVE